MYRTHFLSKELQKIGECKHYAAILSHTKVRQYYSVQTTSSKVGNLLLILLKRKTKDQIKLSPRELLIITGLLHKSDKDIANLFNNFFVNIGPTLTREIKADLTGSLQCIEYTPSNSFSLLQ